MLPAGTSNNNNKLVEDDRFFEKRNCIFRKVWGMNPQTGRSMNALTENSTEYKYDPMYNGISLDLINESAGGVSSEVNFGENALFKLESFHAPILIAGSVTSDPNFSTLTDAAYAELKSLHRAHEVNRYDLALYKDERVDTLTFTNFMFANPDAGMHFRTIDHIPAADLKPVWLKWLDQRTMFQLSPRLVSSDAAYDTKIIHQSSMQKDFALKGEGGKTIYAENDLPLVPMAHIRPCFYNNNTSEWEVMLKSDFETNVNVKQLSTDVLERYKVMDHRKLFDATKVKWCVDFNELFAKNNSTKNLRPMYTLGFDNSTNAFEFKSVLLKEDMYRMSVRRFYTRYEKNKFSTNNQAFYDKLKSGGQFVESFLTALEASITPALKPTSRNKSDNRSITYAQYSNCERDTDTTTDKPNTMGLIKEPKPRADRCVSAYNPTTGELVVQFMPILEDRYDQVNIDPTSGTPDPTFDKYPNYQQWFFDKLLELNMFVNQNARPLPGCKRLIFAFFLENTDMNRNTNSIYSWTKENAPLFFLHVQYAGSSLKNLTLTNINIFFHCHCENLGFNLYGNAEVLYGLERFFTEYITYFDEVYDKRSLQHTLKPRLRGAQPDLLGGEWFKSKNSKVASEKKFGQKWNEFIYKTVDLYDDQDLFQKVRTSYYRDKLRKDGKGQLARVRAWSATNRYAENVKFDAHSHRCQLVFRPVSRANKYDVENWSERATDFGLDSLTQKQQRALTVYNDQLKIMFSESDEAFRRRLSTRFGVEINRYVMPHLSDIKEASYCLSMMGGWEYDIQRFSNYLVEPCTELKGLMGLSQTSGRTPLNSYVYLEDTKNDKITVAKGGENLQYHPLYERSSGLYMGKSTDGSFWQFPVKRSVQNRSVTSRLMMGIANNSDLIEFDTRYNKGVKVAAPRNKQFYSTSDFDRMKTLPLARGGIIKDSSILVELPTFLEESYNYRGQNYQDHTNFTVYTSNNKNLSKAEKRLERKRLGYFDVSGQSSPQPIKKKRADVIPIHFFLADGSRPRQTDKGELTDTTTTNTKFVPFRNVKASIYMPKLSKTWFDKIKRVNFIADEVRRQITTKYRAAKKLDTKTIDVMLTLYNTYNPMKRLSSKSGGAGDAFMSGELSETIDTENSFYQKLTAAWNNVQEGNRAFRERFTPLSSASRNVVLSKSLMDHYVPAASSISDAFDFMFELESVTFPLDVVGLENDDTVYILTDYDVKPSQETNIDGAFDKKIVGRIELKTVKDLDSKMSKGFSQTFTTQEGSTHDGFLQSTPITVRSLHDVRKYKFFFVNSNFKAIRFAQKLDPSTSTRKVETVDVMCKYYISNNLQISQ